MEEMCQISQFIFNNIGLYLEITLFKMGEIIVVVLVCVKVLTSVKVLEI